MQVDGTLKIKSLENYRPFFDRQSSYSLDLPLEQVEKYNRLGAESWNRHNAEEIVRSAFRFIEAFINKEILPLFFFSYGVFFFPLLLQLTALSQPAKEALLQNQVNAEPVKHFLEKLRGFYPKTKVTNLLRFLPDSK